MHSELLEAKRIAETLRFGGDKRLGQKSGPALRIASLRDSFYCNELALSEQVTPELHNSLQTVLKKLSIPETSVVAFVYASSDINAECYAGSDTECVLRLSSSLVHILSKEEFEFVIGHELGHFLLEHGLDSVEINQGLETYILQRAKEISADRIGLLACGSIDVAIKALLKTVSGLNDQYLRFDISTFIAQMRKADGRVSQAEQSTHPSMLVRSKALLWLSMSNILDSQSFRFKEKSIKEVDYRVSQDLERYVDGDARQRIRDPKTDLAIWESASEIVASGGFSKDAQDLFRTRFGEGTLSKLIEFLKSGSLEKNRLEVQKKLDEAVARLQVLTPVTFQKNSMV